MKQQLPAASAERGQHWGVPAESPLPSCRHTVSTDPPRIPFQPRSLWCPAGPLRCGGSGWASTRSCSLGMTKQPPREANDPLNKLVYKPQEQLFIISWQTELLLVMLSEPG